MQQGRSWRAQVRDCSRNHTCSIFMSVRPYSPFMLPLRCFLVTLPLPRSRPLFVSFPFTTPYSQISILVARAMTSAEKANKLLHYQ